MNDCDVVGLKEIAERLHMRAATLHMIRYRGHFSPTAIAVVSGVPVWLWSDVVEWARATGRMDTDA